MSHRKFEAPRHGSLGFLPRKRFKGPYGRVRSFPKDDKSQAPHLTAFMAVKAGMTHVERAVDRPGSQLHKKNTVEATTVLEAAPNVGIGIAGYVETPRGLRTLTTVWAQHLSEEAIRRYYRNWYRSKGKAFTKYAKKYEGDAKDIEKELERMKTHCSVIRLIAHTQVKKLKLRQKKAHITEIQINGGSTADKVDFAKGLLEKEIKVGEVFKENEMCDVIGITKGHGFEGVISRFGVTRLPRKTHKGLRKVACIGSWHPARVRTTVPRAGQHGRHHRVDINKKIYKMGSGSDEKVAMTETDLTAKGINPLGGFPHYGHVREDFIMLKGSIVGPRKGLIILRKSLHPREGRIAREEVNLTFIDTSSKHGHGRFQTKDEKQKFLGITKT